MWFWLFITSSLINVFLFFYIRWLLKIIATINEDMGSLSDLIIEFSAHTKSVHELEMFYGDETLQSLMIHASQLSEKLENLDLVLNAEEEEEEVVSPS